MTKTKVTEELLVRVCAWEPKAVEKFVEILEPVCRARINKVLLRAGDASRRDVDDLCQVTWIALLMNGGRLARKWSSTKGMSFENYAGFKAEHLAKDFVRRKKEVLWRDDEPCASLEPRLDSSRTPDRVVETSDFMQKVLGVLHAELSGSAREIFWLLFVERCDVDEVCVKMKMKPDAVYAWRSRLGRRIEEIAATMGDVR
jgi:RNA polymerase sigma factor (sigma-70 family)